MYTFTFNPSLLRGLHHQYVLGNLYFEVSSDIHVKFFASDSITHVYLSRSPDIDTLSLDNSANFLILTVDLDQDSYLVKGDYICSLSVVYSASIGIASEIPLDNSNDKLDLFQYDSFFQCGTTCNPLYSRLLPNHTLNLSTWSTFRHFSYPSSCFKPKLSSDDVGIFLTSISNVLRFWDSSFAINIALTKGFDQGYFLLLLYP